MILHFFFQVLGKKKSDLSCFLWGFGSFSTPYHAHLVFSVSWRLPCLSHSAEEHPLVQSQTGTVPDRLWGLILEEIVEKVLELRRQRKTSDFAHGSES